MSTGESTESLAFLYVLLGLGCAVVVYGRRWRSGAVERRKVLSFRGGWRPSQ